MFQKRPSRNGVKNCNWVETHQFETVDDFIESEIGKLLIQSGLYHQNRNNWLTSGTMEFRCYAYKSEHFQKAVCQVKFLVRLVEGDRVHVCEPDGANPDHQHIGSGKTVNANYKAAKGN